MERKGVTNVCCWLCKDDSSTSPEIGALLEYYEQLTSSGEEDDGNSANRLDESDRKGMPKFPADCCGSCQSVLKTPLDRKRQVKAVEARVIELQKEILKELRMLDEYMNEFYRSVKDVEEMVVKKVTSCEGERNNHVTTCHERLQQFVKDLGLYRQGLSSKIGVPLKREDDRLDHEDDDQGEDNEEVEEDDKKYLAGNDDAAISPPPLFQNDDNSDSENNLEEETAVEPEEGNDLEDKETGSAEMPAISLGSEGSQLKTNTETKSWHRKTRPFCCPTCNKSFPYQIELTRHQRMHQDPEKRDRHVCKTCDKTFLSREGLRYHQTHTESCAVKEDEYLPRRSQRPKRQQRQSVFSDLDNDAEDEEAEENEGTSKRRRKTRSAPKTAAPEDPVDLTCPKCGKVLQSKHGLRYHQTYTCVKIKKDSASSRPECSLCHKKFVHKDALTKHMSLVHTPDRKFIKRPHQCPQCQFRFKEEPDLKLHVKNHSRQRPYVCRKECGMTWVLPAARLSHEKQCGVPRVPKPRPKRPRELPKEMANYPDVNFSKMGPFQQLIVLRLLKRQWRVQLDKNLQPEECPKCHQLFYWRGRTGKRDYHKYHCKGVPNPDDPSLKPPPSTSCNKRGLLDFRQSY